MYRVHMHLVKSGYFKITNSLICIDFVYFYCIDLKRYVQVSIRYVNRLSISFDYHKIPLNGISHRLHSITKRRNFTQLKNNLIYDRLK